LTRRTKCRVKRRVTTSVPAKTRTPQIGVDSLGVFRDSFNADLLSVRVSAVVRSRRDR
jgi:hypothetical protein